jgi:hypothetical protein
VPYAERYRCYAARVGSPNEPLFVAETLKAGGRYKVFAAAVNSSGNAGPHSEVVVAEVRASAAA